jgi:hypothetical protein
MTLVIVLAGLAILLAAKSRTTARSTQHGRGWQGWTEEERLLDLLERGDVSSPPARMGAWLLVGLFLMILALSALL